MKITRPIDLGKYYDEYRGQVVHVWVNPPKTIRREREVLLQTYAKLIHEVSLPVAKQGKGAAQILQLLQMKLTPSQDKRLHDLDRKFSEWFTVLWSQHADSESHWTVDEIDELKEVDHALYNWLVEQSILMIDTFFHANIKMMTAVVVDAVKTSGKSEPTFRKFRKYKN
jgi:hypothetical protein